MLEKEPEIALAPDRPEQRRRPRRASTTRPARSRPSSAGAASACCAPTAPSAGFRTSECGKLVVAVDDSEVERLRELERRAHANGVPGRPLARRRGAPGGRAARRRRRRAPLADDRDHRLPGRRAGLRATTSRRPAARCALGARGDRRSRGAATTVRVTTAGEELEFDRLVVCAGLQSDRLARLAGDEREPTIVPFRGEYYRLAAEREEPRPRAPLPGAGPGIPVPRRPLHAAGRRRRRRRAERRARARARGVPAARRPARATSPRRCGSRRLSARSRAGTGGWACTSCAARCSSARSRPRRAATSRSSRPPTSCPAPRRRARAGARPRRLARRRLPDPPYRPGHGRSQRALARGDLVHGDRRADRIRVLSRRGEIDFSLGAGSYRIAPQTARRRPDPRRAGTLSPHGWGPSPRRRDHRRLRCDLRHPPARAAPGARRSRRT